jgi:hypothetical protein
MANYPEDPSDEEIDKFVAQFDGPAEMYAFFYRTEGEALVRETLALVQGSSEPLYREELEEQAEEIEQAGMTKCAALLREYAEKAVEAKYQCPYPRQHIPGWRYDTHYGTQRFGTYNAQHWLKGQRRKYPDFDDSRVVYVDPSKPYYRPQRVDLEDTSEL